MEPADHQSIALVQHQRTSVQTIDRSGRQSEHDIDDIFSLVQLWTKRGKKERKRDMGKDKADVLQVLGKLLKESPSPALNKTDDDGRTALHLALLHRMPKQFIVVLVQYLKQSELDREDKRRRRAVDYLLDWEDVDDSVSNEILQKFIAQGVDLSEERNCSMCEHPLARLCRRTVDGCQLLELAGPLSISQDFKNKMLEEAVKRGSSSTVEYLLKVGADASSTRYLLHDAAKANHDSLNKVCVLMRDGKLDPSQVSAEGLTLVHVAADRHPPTIDLLDLALKEGVDPNKKDSSGDTALHKVTKNYSERTVPWKKSEQAMELLLRHPQIDPNIPNSRGLTPLGILMTARRALPVDLLWMWVKKDAGVTSIHESDLKESGPKCAFAEMSKRSDGHVLVKIFIEHLGVDRVRQYLKYMLEAAVEKGTAKTVEELLKNGADATEDNGRLLMIAARSNTDASKKLNCLKENGANPKYTNGKGFSVLHAVAQSPTATEEFLKNCTDILNLEVGWKDYYGDTPLHVAARSTHSCSDVLLGNLLEFGDPNALNYRDENPLRLVLQHNHSNKELRRNKVVLLLMSGCKPTLKDFEKYKGDADDFENLFLSVEVMTEAHKPLQLFLTLAKYGEERLEEKKNPLYRTLDWTQSHPWTIVNDSKIEEAAVKVIEDAGKRQELFNWKMTNKEFDDVHERGWDKFLANKNVGKVLEQKFFGHLDVSSPDKRRRMYYRLPWLVSKFLLGSLLLPIYMLITALYPRINYGETLDPRRLPIVTFYSSMVSYMAFLGLLFAHAVEHSPHQTLSWPDCILLVYIVAMGAEELYQMKHQGLGYVTVTNICDLLMVMFFIAFFIFRVIGDAIDSLVMYRVAEYVFAVLAAMSFLRLLYYIQVIRKLGPILFSFKAITTEVVSFMTILLVMFYAFGIAVTVVYKAGIYTQEFQNGNISLPHLVRGVWPTLQTLYWSLYGQIDYGDLDSEYDVLYLEIIFGQTLFAVWCLLSTIVLLNMLIALIDDAFDRVKKQNANLVWNLAVYHIIRDIENEPSFPLPMNLFYFASIIFKMNLFEANPGTRDVVKPDKSKNQTDRIAGKVNAKSQPAGDTKTQAPESVGALELQVSSLKTELSREMKILRYQTKYVISKQTTKVRACVRMLKSRLAEDPSSSNGHFKRAEGKDSSYSELVSESDSDTDFESDVDTEEQLEVRHERVSYDESQPISYEGNGHQVGCCQFLSKPMSPTSQYFEVRIVDYGINGSIGIGLAHRSYPLDRMPGLSNGSIAYHCDNGQVFFEHGRGSSMASPSQQGDIIGCGIKSYATNNGFEDSPVVYFTRNGEELGRKKVKRPKSGFFPIVGLRSQGQKVEVNWNAKWKSLEDVKDEDQGDIVLKLGIEFDATQRTFDNLISPDVLHHNKVEIESDSDATDGPVLHMEQVRQSELVYAMGNNLFKYDRDNLSGVGVHQSLVRPMSREFSCYEAIVRNYGMNGTIAVGLAGRNYPLNTQPGWAKGSIAWHCNDGGLYIENRFPRALCTPAKTGDIIGCGIDFEAKGQNLPGMQLDSTKSAERLQVYFTHNGIRIADEIIEEPEGGLFPTVGMQSPEEMVEIITSTVPAFEQARAERVDIEGNFVSFVSNPHDDVGGIQLQCNMDELNYFEMTIINAGEQGNIGIGIAHSEYALDSHPGWYDRSIAFHCYNGRLHRYHNGSGKDEPFYNSPSLAKDIIGCGIRKNQCDQLHVFFTHNGREIGQKSFKGVEATELYPTVCMHSRGEKVKINAYAHWDERPEEPIFSRWERIKIAGNKASYEPDEYTKVGTVQLSREINKEYPYFEVEVTNCGEKCSLGVGLAPYNYPLDLQPGWHPGSVGYHCGDGCLFGDVSWKGEPTGSPGGKGDLLGWGLKYPDKEEDKVTVFFTHNGEEVRELEMKRPSRGGLFPVIGMQGRGEEITVIKDAEWPKPAVEETHL